MAFLLTSRVIFTLPRAWKSGGGSYERAALLMFVLFFFFFRFFLELDLGELVDEVFGDVVDEAA